MNALQDKIEIILNRSDIVWPRYGSETVQQLAARLVEAMQSAPAASIWWVSKEES